jgi:hypothetical protein
MDAPNWFAAPLAEALFLRALTICLRSVVSIGPALEWPAQTRSRYQVSVVFPSVDGFAPLSAPGVRGCLGFDRLLWVPPYSYARGNGIIPSDPTVRVIPELYRPMLDTIFSRWPATRHIQFALAGALFRLGVGANGTTILSIATGLIAGLAFARSATIVGVLLLGIGALLDAVDGTIAREFAAATPLGGILDLCSDRVVEIALILRISWRTPRFISPL